jgi:hypothetical protein
MRTAVGPGIVSAAVYNAIVYPSPHDIPEREVYDIWRSELGQVIFESFKAESPLSPVWAAVLFPRPPWWDDAKHGKHTHLKYCSACRGGNVCFGGE